MNGNTFLWASGKKGAVIFKISLNTNQYVGRVKNIKCLAVLR